MEYTKDEIFSICYNEKKDKLKKHLHTKIFKKIVKNKFITMLVTMGVLFSIVNFTLIYCFFEILNRI